MDRRRGTQQRQRNDVHSGMNSTRHARVSLPASAEQVAMLLRQAQATGRAVACAGGHHAMGGQQFLQDGWLLDTRRLHGVHAFDPERGLITLAAGTQWPQLQRFLAAQRDADGHGWAIAQKQTGADDFSLGGSLASNIHGRGLARAPLVADIERFTLVLASGEVVAVDRQQQPELFAWTVGGYGLFGVVTDVTLRLVKRQLLQRRVRLLRAAELAEAFASARAAGAEYGDFQFAVDPTCADFLDLGVFACYTPCADNALGTLNDHAAPRHSLSASDWSQLLLLAHVDKREAFRRYSAFYLASDGQRYASDDHQFGVYLDGYHRAIDAHLGHTGSETITELYVPPTQIGNFLAALAVLCRQAEMDVIYGTVRQIRKDSETRLAWAAQDWACVVLNLHVRHDAAGYATLRRNMRALNALALSFGGSFYLTYGLHADADQLRQAYPMIDALSAAKRRWDPQSTLQSTWWRRLLAVLAQPEHTAMPLPARRHA